VICVGVGREDVGLYSQMPDGGYAALLSFLASLRCSASGDLGGPGRT